MGANTVAVTDGDFEAQVLKASGPVLVDFWAEWCGPCRALAPTLEELAADKAGSLKVVKVNVDDSPEAPTKYGVRSIPTIVLFKDGKAVAQTIGVMQKSDLYKWVETAMA